MHYQLPLEMTGTASENERHWLNPVKRTACMPKVTHHFNRPVFRKARTEESKCPRLCAVKKQHLRSVLHVTFLMQQEGMPDAKPSPSMCAAALPVHRTARTRAAKVHCDYCNTHIGLHRHPV